MSSLLNSTSSIAQTSFELHGADFHILSYLETEFNKTFQIKIQQRIFRFTKEEIYLLSPKCYSKILKSSLPFTIPIPSDQKYETVNYQSLIHALEDLSSLFSSSTQIQITQTNILVYEYLSNILKNEYLGSICKFFLTDQNQVFEISSKKLHEGSKNFRKFLFDFKVFINDKVILCNKTFSCCLSRTILQAVSIDTSIKEYHFKDIQNEQLLVSFFNILCEQSFKGDGYSSRDVIEYLSIVN
jgi:hypothetical protein